MSDLSRDDKRIYIEAIETTVSHELKVSALMGKKNYSRLIDAINTWKRLINTYYTDIPNFDGSYIFLYFDNAFGLIKEYHDGAYANYGDIIQNNPEMITRLSAGTQSVIIGRISEDSIDIKPVEYMELSETTDFDPLYKAMRIFENKESWKASGDEARGPLYVSQVCLYLEIIVIGFTMFEKTMRYHAERQANPKKYPDYHKQFIFYLLSQGKPFIPFKPISQTNNSTTEEKILDYLELIFPESIHYLKLSELLNGNPYKINSQLGRLLKKELIERTEKGIYQFKPFQPISTKLREDEN